MAGRAGIIFSNPASGPNDLSAEVRDRFSDHDLRDCDPDGLSDQVAAAAKSGPPFVGVAGGDGSIRAASAALRGGPVPLLVIPTGTRNHFAASLGIGSLEMAAAAIAGPVIAVDVAEVNGRVFVNNSSIGIYPLMVRDRESRARVMPKRLAHIAAAWGQLRHGQKTDLTVEGVQHRAWMAFVGNGCYGETPFDLLSRTSLDSNLLDIRVVDARGRFARLRVVVALLGGGLSRSALVHAISAEEVTIDTSAQVVEVALDGEVEPMQSPLRYVSCSRALRVLVPSDSALAADAPPTRITTERGGTS